MQVLRAQADDQLASGLQRVDRRRRGDARAAFEFELPGHTVGHGVDRQEVHRR